MNDAIGKLFYQMVELCKHTGLVKMGHIAIDGTKIKANTSKHKAVSYRRMQDEESRLKAEIAERLKKAEKIDAAEDRIYGNGRGDELPDKLQHRERALRRLKRRWLRRRQGPKRRHLLTKRIIRTRQPRE